MRIVYLNPIGALGGGERSLLDIFAALRAIEPSWQMHLIAGAEGPLLDEARKLGVQSEVIRMPDELLVLGDSALGSAPAGKVRSTLRLLNRGALAALGARQYAKKIRARLQELKPSLVHSNGIKFHLITRLMPKIAAPVVWHIRDFIGARKLMRRAIRWAAPACSLAIANSESVAAESRALLPGVTVKTILNCVDTSHFSPGSITGDFLDELAGLSSAPRGTLRVGMLASYARWKGQDLFLKAAAEVKRRAPDLPVRFYIVGGPIYKTQGSQFSVDELRSIAIELKLDGTVGFIPFQSDPTPVYRALGIVVHASTQPEPFGRTIAEAMSCGRPVIASLAGGVPELITPNVDALAFAPNDISELALRIELLLKNETLRRQLASAARSAAVARFSRERLGSELHNVYRSLLPSSA